MGAVWVVLGLARRSRPRISRGEADSQPRGLPRRFVLPLSAASTLRIWEALVLQSLGRVLQPEEELGSRGGERWGLAGRQAAVCSWAKAPFDSARGRGGCLQRSLRRSVAVGCVCSAGSARFPLPANHFSFDFQVVFLHLPETPLSPQHVAPWHPLAGEVEAQVPV